LYFDVHIRVAYGRRLDRHLRGDLQRAETTDEHAALAVARLV
jgi:hypothetical protein